MLYVQTNEGRNFYIMYALYLNIAWIQFFGSFPTYSVSAAAYHTSVSNYECDVKASYLCKMLRTETRNVFIQRDVRVMALGSSSSLLLRENILVTILLVCELNLMQRSRR